MIVLLIKIEYIFKMEDIESGDENVSSKNTLPKNLDQQTVTNSQLDSKDKKVDCLLKAAGDAPIMKKRRWNVDGVKPVSYIIEFIKKYIKCEPSESLFVYVNQTFVPSPDQTLNNLYECFGTDGKLVLHYCKSEAWG
nr:autophagy protein 12-like [Hydra vulgaris]